jgi:putative PIN family toxin of toxin-antitoxin system
LLDELGRTLRRKFDTDPSDVPFLIAYRDRARVVRPKALPKPVCCDSDDDKVLATAIAGQADFILTGDDDLLVLREYHGIQILSPRQFVEMMDGEAAV